MKWGICEGGTYANVVLVKGVSVKGVSLKGGSL